MVKRGTFRLYDSVDPALTAGSYVLTTEVDIQTADDAALPVKPLSTHINVTAPRFRLPPDQALMTFPPANSEGAYESRLPQIALKRRTLPWDRAPAPVDTVVNGQTVQDKTPWLALVVIAEGEGQVVHDAPWQECVTPGVVIQGDVDTRNASYLSVPQSTVDMVFPSVDDLILLSHVREVNVDDTEVAMGDDDGFLSVIIANRMPQFDRENCRPKAYTACLINLEGQLDVLPEPPAAEPFFLVSDLIFTQVAATYNAAVASGQPIALVTRGEERRIDGTDPQLLVDAVRRGEVVFHEGALVDRAGLRGDMLNRLGAISQEDFLDGNFEAIRAEAEAAAGERVLRVAGTFGSFDFPLDEIVPERFYRFPVLTSWRFTCTGKGSFEQLMQDLDVGLLGTKSEGGYRRQLPDCLPKVTGNASDAPPVKRLPLEIAETGHVALPHVTRTGVGRTAWYRGPLSPHQLLRNPLAEDAQLPVLAHVSDHLRMMTPEGREDVSLAVAFETGRLLAMAQPSFVAAMLRWRDENFGAARARANQRAAISDQLHLLNVFINDDDITRLGDTIKEGLFARELEGTLFKGIDEVKTGAISTPRVIADPGLAIPALQGNANALLAAGLGLDQAVVNLIAERPTAPSALSALQFAEPGLVATEALDLDAGIQAEIKATLDQGITGMAEIAVGREVLESGDADAIDDFETFDDFIFEHFGRN